MEFTIIHTDYNDDDDTETEIELTVEVDYTPGEREERWGRYGATPGYGPEVEIVSITVPLEVEGPHRNPYAWEYERVKDLSDDKVSKWYRESTIIHYNSYKSPGGPVVYMVPWDGELSDSELTEVMEACERAVEDARAEARRSSD